MILLDVRDMMCGIEGLLDKGRKIYKLCYGKRILINTKEQKYGRDRIKTVCE